MTTITESKMISNPVYSILKRDCETKTTSPQENFTDSKTCKLSSQRFKSDDDFGHIKHEQCQWNPSPSTFEQLSKIVIESNKLKTPLSCRGQAHSTGGQAQVKDGILIDLSKLNKIYPVQKDEERVTVQCGAKWKDVVDECLKFDMTPPVLTNYLGLSVGGVLSVGGFSGQTNDEGLVADNVEELTVMTMDGKIHHCSKTQNADLFHASLTTLGQFTIILEATLRLIAAPPKCQVFNIYYDNLEKFMKHQTELVKNKSFHYIEGQVVNCSTDATLSNITQKEWGYMIEVAYYQYDELRQCPFDFKSLDALEIKKEDKSYKDFVHRMKPGVKFLKENGSWHHPHPWINVFIPQEHTYNIVNEVIKSLTLEDTGGWPILFYPINSSSISCPFFQIPKSGIFWSFSILRHAKDQETVLKMIENNRTLYEKVAAIGGKIYPIGSTPMNENDWIAQYGGLWKTFENLKKEDPYYLLGRGQGIFKHKEPNLDGLFVKKHLTSSENASQRKVRERPKWYR